MALQVFWRVSSVLFIGFRIDQEPTGAIDYKPYMALVL